MTSDAEDFGFPMHSLVIRRYKSSNGKSGAQKRYKIGETQSLYLPSRWTDLWETVTIFLVDWPMIRQRRRAINDWHCFKVVLMTNRVGWDVNCEATATGAMRAIGTKDTSPPSKFRPSSLNHTTQKSFIVIFQILKKERQLRVFVFLIKGKGLTPRTPTFIMQYFVMFPLACMPCKQKDARRVH